MLPEKILAFGISKSCIRELFAYGAKRKAEIGADKVFDFSLGNPSVPAPPCVEEAIRELLSLDSTSLHGYTPATGLPSLRRTIAADLQKRFGLPAREDLIYVTCGAAAGLAICMHALLLPGEEVIAFAPFFPEYRMFTEGVGGKLVVVPPAAGLQPDLDALAASLTEKTKVVIVNTPNNPSGVVLSEECLKKLCGILHEAELRFGHPIYLVSDEPYRELVYDGQPVPCVLHFYDNAILDYSYSKSLSLPGERIGYLAVSSRMQDAATIFNAICGGGRVCGFVNAPRLMQRVIEKCIDKTSDISEYKFNRDLLYNGLKELGYDCVYPDGAFYLFVKTPEPDAMAFAERAKKYELLLVPSDDFGVPGYVRIAYCVSADQIRRSMPAFRKLAEEYGLC